AARGPGLGHEVRLQGTLPEALAVGIPGQLPVRPAIPAAALFFRPTDGRASRETPVPRRWKVRPEHSTWGDFGDDDQVGRLNLIRGEGGREAAREVREGLAFCLSLPLDLPGGNLLVPQRLPPVRSIASMPNGQPFVNYPAAADNERWIDHSSDDAVLLYT